jgi:hypothetical protein
MVQLARPVIEAQSALTRTTLDRATSVQVMSAKHGLVALDEVIEPCDRRMDALTAPELASLVIEVGRQLAPITGQHEIVEIIAFLPRAYLAVPRHATEPAATDTNVVVTNAYERCRGIGDQRHVPTSMRRDHALQGRAAAATGQDEAMPDTELVATRYLLGLCAWCRRPVRRDEHEDHGAVVSAEVLITCPDCGHDLYARRVLAATTTETCGYGCRTAGRARCRCSCGGAHHGALFDADANPDDQVRAVTAYQSRLAVAEDQARARFHRWAMEHRDVIDALTGPDRVLDTPLLLQLAAQVEQDPPHPLTADQVSAVRSALARRAQRASRRGLRQWQPAPTGQVEITGRVMSVRPRHDPDTSLEDDEATYRMTVDCGSYLVEVPLPPDLMTRAPGSGPVDALQGRHVRLTTTLTPDSRNPAFGHGTMPTVAAVVPARARTR